MRTALLASGTYALGSVMSFSAARGHVNGVAIIAPTDVGNALVTIQRAGTNKTHVLGNGIRLQEYAAISNFDRGYNRASNMALQIIMDRLVTGAEFTDVEREGVETDPTVLAELGLQLFFIELGSLHLSEDTKLEVSIAFNATSPTPGAVSAFGVSFAEVPDYMISLAATNDYDATHQGVDSIYLANSGTALFVSQDDPAGVITSLAIDIQLEDHTGTWLTNILGSLIGSMIANVTEGAISQRAVQIYKRTDAVPEDVYCKVSGAGLSAADHRLLVRRAIYDQPTTTRNTKKAAFKLAERVSNLEKRDYSTAKALRHSGELVKAETIAGAAATLEG